ncbi:MAG: thioredoxin, partial [Bacteroidaceae bacterium]|nr:thioredoxin [Bacteroidaceae bacterium]
RAEKLMKMLGFPGRFGFPVFVVLNPEGKVLHIQDSGYLEEGNSYDQKKVMRFFQNWTPKAVKGIAAK